VLLFKSIYNLKTINNKDYLNKITETINIIDLKDKYQITWFDNGIKEHLIEKKNFKFYIRGDILFNEPLKGQDSIEHKNSLEINKILEIIFIKKISHTKKKLLFSPEIIMLLLYNLLSLSLLFYELIDYKLMLLINIISLTQIVIRNNIAKTTVLLILSIMSIKFNIIFFFSISLIILLNFFILNRKYNARLIFLIFTDIICMYLLIFSYQNNTQSLSAILLIIIFLFRNLFYKSSNIYVFVFLLMMISSNNSDHVTLFLPFIAILDIFIFKVLFKLFPTQRGNI
jgi:hypothetical protein